MTEQAKWSVVAGIVVLVLILVFALLISVNMQKHDERLTCIRAGGAVGSSDNGRVTCTFPSRP